MDFNTGFTSILQMSLSEHPKAVSKACYLLQLNHLATCRYVSHEALPWWCSTQDGDQELRYHHTCVSVLSRVKGHPKNLIGNPAQSNGGLFEPVLPCRRIDH